VIGQFVVLGNLPFAAASYSLQWSGIDSPLSWPTPSSATAIAQQSGRQDLPAEFGSILNIFGGDQYGLVFQPGGITRMTYIGGDDVFQFSQIDKGTGCAFAHGALKVGNLIYFVSLRGFYVTDGVSVIPIGDGIVDHYFLSRYDTSRTSRVCAGVDFANKLIYWTFPTAADSGNPSSALVYNFEEKRWALVVDSIQYFARNTEGKFVSYGFEAFGNDNRLGRFTGTPGTAILTTPEIEPNPGGFSRINGIKGLVDVTTNALTVALGTRNDLGSSVTYTSETTANSRTGFADFRSEARYHRARLTISGTFNAAQGIEYLARESGDV
jgi:hypothetical protein